MIMAHNHRHPLDELKTGQVQVAMAQRTKPLHIWLEINQYLAEETKQLFALFAEAEVIRDLSDNPRFIQAIVLPKG